MDFGLVGLEGFVGPEGRALFQAPDPATKPKGLGSGFGKQERSGSGEDDWRNPKLARTDELSASKTMPLHQSTPLFRSNSIFSDDCHPGQRMLSFSTPRLEVPLLNKDGGLVERSTQNLAFPFYQQSSYSRNTGIGSGSFNGNMHGPFAGVRAPFTPSQWIELEHQALIYKYITANVPVPSNLLIPIKRSFNPFGLSGSYAGSLYPNSLGWGSFHLGLASSTDPEPGRCRRTDGKKWRCSRDAVADQKYCERHINRGRHRSRKPVEGQSGHAVSGRTNSKVAPLAPPLSASVIPNCGASNSLAIAQNQLNELQPGAANPATDVFVNRLMLNKGNVCDRLQDRRGLSAMSPNVKSRDGPFSMPKLHNPFEESSESVFGFVSSDSLLNPSQKSAHMDSKSYTSDSILSPSQKSAFMDCKSYCSFLDFNDQESQDQQHPLRQFIEDWPKDQSDRSTILWPEELKSDWTQLSMAIPVATDFSSSSSSPMHERLALSPLRLSRDLDTFQIGLGVSSDFSELTERQTNWIPIPWGTSMGGPLGEALNNTTNTLGACKKSSALNLTTEEWDGSPQMESSPTGVLQKTTFGSLSNSSSGSSPRTENNKTHEGATFCDGSTLGSSSIPSLQ